MKIAAKVVIIQSIDNSAVCQRIHIVMLDSRKPPVPTKMSTVLALEWVPSPLCPIAAAMALMAPMP